MAFVGFDCDIFEEYCLYSNVHELILEEYGYSHENCYGIRYKNSIDIFRWACSGGRLNIVNYMCESGININAVKSLDNWAFRWSCHNGHLDVVKYLWRFGLNLGDARSDNNSAFRWARNNGHLEVVRYLESIEE